nr:hypothetical protein [Human alphaherpesvirus 2]
MATRSARTRVVWGALSSSSSVSRFASSCSSCISSRWRPTSSRLRTALPITSAVTRLAPFKTISP